MKKLLFCLIALVASSARAGDTASDILRQVYGAFNTACTQDADIDTNTANRLGPFVEGRRYVAYCHDGAGAGVACWCLQGTSAVDAQGKVGILLGAGEKVIVRFTTGNLYLSCIPFANNMKLDVCPLD